MVLCCSCGTFIKHLFFVRHMFYAVLVVHTFIKHLFFFRHMVLCCSCGTFKHLFFVRHMALCCSCGTFIKHLEKSTIIAPPYKLSFAVKRLHGSEGNGVIQVMQYSGGKMVMLVCMVVKVMG